MRYAIGFLAAAVLALVFLATRPQSQQAPQAPSLQTATSAKPSFGWKIEKQEVVAIGPTDVVVIQGVPKARKVRVAAQSQTPISFALEPKEDSERPRDPRAAIDFPHMPCSATNAL